MPRRRTKSVANNSPKAKAALKHKTIADTELTLHAKNNGKVKTKKTTAKTPAKKTASKKTASKKTPAKTAIAKKTLKTKSPAKRPKKSESQVIIYNDNYPADLNETDPDIQAEQLIARSYYDAYWQSYNKGKGTALYQIQDTHVIVNLAWLLVQLKTIRIQAVKNPLQDHENGNSKQIEIKPSGYLQAQMQISREINSILRLLGQSPSLRAQILAAGSIIQHHQAPYSEGPKDAEGVDTFDEYIEVGRTQSATN